MDNQLAANACSQLPQARNRNRRSTKILKALFSFGLPVLLLIFLTSPSPYLVEGPGKVLNTLGALKTSSGMQQLLIPDAQLLNSAENTGALNMLTVNISGNKEQPRTWGSLIFPLFNPAEDIVPIAKYYPEHVSVAQFNEQSARLMNSAQETAVAVALRKLGYTVSTRVAVAAIMPETDAASKLKPGDQLLAVNGIKLQNSAELVSVIQTSTSGSVTLEILRDGVQQQVNVKTYINSETKKKAIGVFVMHEYDLPHKVKFAHSDIGGPSAGLIFTLAIIDKSLAEDLTGGLRISATGTIEDNGNVGPIGGLKQKMYGANAAGTDLFLMPQANCQDLPAAIPGNMTVVAVQNIDQALTAVRAFRDGQPTAGLSLCNKS